MEKDSIYIYMEYMCCGSLASLLQQYGPFEEKVIKKFEQQNSELISLHEEEINVLSIESLLTSQNFEKNKGKSNKLTQKQISDSLMELRNYHNKEIEEVKVFQEAVINYIKKHSKKLSLVASEM